MPTGRSRGHSVLTAAGPHTCSGASLPLRSRLQPLMLQLHDYESTLEQ